MLRKSLSLLCHFYKYKKAVIDAFSSLSVVFTTSLWVVCLSVLDYEVQSDNPYIQIIIFVIWIEESSPRDTYHSWNALEWFKIIYVCLRATGRASLLLKYPVLVLRYIYCWQYFFTPKYIVCISSWMCSSSLWRVPIFLKQKQDSHESFKHQINLVGENSFVCGGVFLAPPASLFFCVCVVFVLAAAPQRC